MRLLITLEQDVAAIEPIVSAPMLTEGQIGAIIFGGSFAYVAFVIICDTIKAKKLAVSKNIIRMFLDGLTFSTGITVALALADSSIFKVVASNAVYVTVTSGTLILGPILNLAERYGFTID